MRFTSKTQYQNGKYELAGPIVAQLIPSIYERTPEDYMTGETWWDYGPNYFKRPWMADWMESYLDEYQEIENYEPSNYLNEFDEDSD